MAAINPVNADVFLPQSTPKAICQRVIEGAIKAMGAWLGLTFLLGVSVAPLAIAGLVVAVATGHSIALAPLGIAIAKVAALTLSLAVVAGAIIGLRNTPSVTFPVVTPGPLGAV